MSESESAAGRELGDFRILREIGRGGMGTVYLAEQCSLRRTVALKVLNPGVSLNPNVVKRFQREAEAAGRLHHPYIVQVFAVGEEDGTHFFAMEYVEGESLDQIARRLRKGKKIDGLEMDEESATGEDEDGGLSNEEEREGDSADSTASETQEYILGAARLMAEIADALDYAHRHGIIHRDVKPHNILVDRTGRPFLVDFGLAQAEGAMGITKTGEVFGTPTYMSPEQVAGSLAKIDHRTDIYSLGCSFYELITLHRPFEGKTPQETVRRILTVEPKDPRKLNRAVPKDLATIVTKCIEKDPDKRYTTCATLQSDLKRFLAGEPIQARPIGALEKGARFVARRPWQSIAVGIIALLAITVALQVFKGREASKDMHSIEAAKLAQDADALYAVDVAGAERKVLEALDKDARCAKAHLVHGKILRGQGRFEDARVAFDQAARLDAMDPEPLSQAGDLLKSRREFRAAADVYREALKRKESLHEVHDNLAECLRELGLRDESTKAFERAEAIRREQAMPLVEQALQSIALGESLAESDRAASIQAFEAAALRASESLSKHPGLHESNLWRGVAHLRLARFSDAATDLNLFVSKNSRDPAGYFYRGEMHLLQGNLEEARRDFERAVQTDKGKTESRYIGKAQLRLAQIFVARAELEKAMAVLDALLKVENANQEARLLRAIGFAQRNAFEEADADFSTAQSLGGALASSATLGRALLLEKQGFAEKALEALLAAEKSYPQDARVLYHRARVGIALRRNDASDRAALDRSIAIDPDNAGAYLARFSSRIEEPGAEKDFFESLDHDPEFAVRHFFDCMRGDFSGWSNLLALAPPLPQAPTERLREGLDAQSLRFLSPKWRVGLDLEIPSCEERDLKNLIGDLHSPAPKAREYAEKQLFACGWNAIAALRSSIESPASEPDLQALLERLEEQRRLAERQSVERWLDEGVKSSAASRRLVDLGRDAFPSLLGVLAHSPDPTRKHLAYKAIVSIGRSEEAVSGLGPLLANADALVRFYAVRALTHFGSIPSPETLHGLFREESGPVRIAVLFAAGMAGELHDSLRSLLGDALRDTRPLMRFMGTRLIGDRGDKALALSLRRALMKEPEVEVREQMVRSLSMLGEEGAVLWNGLKEDWGRASASGPSSAEMFVKAFPQKSQGDSKPKREALLERFLAPEFSWVRIHWLRSWTQAQLVDHADLLLRMRDAADPAERFTARWALRRLGVGTQVELEIPAGSAAAFAKSLLAEASPLPLSPAESARLKTAIEKADGASR